ncbi:MAG: copper amine oxidase N-terminal domain-containing protein [Paenibacillaceae bacterium]|nr:copper amine oxidase N-terminal domain-containing protein [Paenibacillaceae bacterium]
MRTMKKAAAVAALSLALVVPGVSLASDMKPMKTGEEMGGMTSMSGGMNGGMTSMDNGMAGMMDMSGYVPLRLFAETLGYKLMWDGGDRSITLTFAGMDMMDMDMMNMDMKDMKDKYMLKLMLDSTAVTVGMERQTLAHAPVLMDGTTYVGKDFIARYLLSPFMMDTMQPMK